MKLRLLWLLLCLALAACSRETALDMLAAGESGRVAEVVSGHYFVLDNGLEVRLAGVVSPKEDEPHGRESLAELRRLIDGQEVQLFYGGLRRDDYDRAIAHVRLRKSGAWLQKRLLSAGDVRVKTWADNRALAAPMLEAEARARAARRGLWSDPAYQVRLPAELHGRYGFQVLEARVRRVEALDSGAARLLFDDDVRAFVVPRAAKDFDSAGLVPTSLRGKLLRVRGIVSDRYGDPELRLDHPEQVERLEEPG